MAYQSITRAQLRTQLQAKWEGVPFWTDAEANWAINEALRTWQLLTGRWKGRIVLSTAPSQYEYPLASTILYRTTVTFNGLPMTPSSYTDLSAGRPRWRQETTASGGDVPRRPTVWVPISLGLIAIWPADAAGHNGLAVDGVATTPVLTDDAEYVNLPSADLDPLLGFALHVASLKRGGVYFQQTLPDYQAFLQAAAEQNQILTTSDLFRRWAGLDDRALKPLQSPSAPKGLAVASAGGDQ